MRRLLAICLVLIVSAAMFGFAEGKQEEPTGPVKLMFWTHEDKNRAALEDRFITEFQAANPDVTIEKVTHGSTKIQEIILTAFAANQGPDIFNMSIEDEYPYIANGRVAPVSPQALGFSSTQAIVDSYIPKVLDPVTVKGKLYGLPLELTNWCIYLNKKIFRSAGLDPEKDYPKTWEDMVRVSEKIVIRNGDIITRRGFDFRYPYYLVEMVPMVEQLGGKLLSDDGKSVIVGDKAWTQFLDFMKAWGPNGKNLGSPTYKAGPFAVQLRQERGRHGLHGPVPAGPDAKRQSRFLRQPGLDGRSLPAVQEQVQDGGRLLLRALLHGERPGAGAQPADSLEVHRLHAHAPRGVPGER